MAQDTLIMVCLSLSLLLWPAISSPTTKDWCVQTPYPQPCEYFLSNNPKYSTLPIHSKSDFFSMSTRLTLDRCTLAHTNLYSLGSKCRNEFEKAAWADCMELYEHVVHKINMTVDPSVKCTSEDAQTWLSTALTDLETCLTGFSELGVDGYMPPLMSNNVSMLLRNSLALNQASTEVFGSPSSETGFPGWFKPGDRKLLQTPSPQADVVVAQDGSGNYRTVREAVAAAARRSGSGRFVIHVKAGVYSENVEIGKGLTKIMLVGDGIGKTIITGSRSVGGGTTTFRSATVAVVGEGFIGRDITFRNTAGPGNNQAVALRSGSDLSVFYRCSFEGYQDTLYVHSERQFYKECDIYGTVDFIFGNAAVVLQNCNIHPRKPPNRTNAITAQGRSDPNQNTGISIHNCRITAAPDLAPVQATVRTYLGRPWREYSRTVIMTTFLGDLIDPAGWMPWAGNFALNTLYYGEYGNTGPGSSTVNRVKWKGYRVITSVPEASRFTVGNFIAGESWIPGTTVPFTSGL